MNLPAISWVILFALVSLDSRALSEDVVRRGWLPSVEFAGAGDAKVAVSAMREMAELHRITFNQMKCHPQTQQFVDGLWASLDSFDLRRFYQQLPQDDGEWRQLEVYGRREGDQYKVGPKSFLATRSGQAIQVLGDMASTVRAKELTSELGTSYLLSHELTVGVGAFSWDAVVDSFEESLSLAVEGDPRFGNTAKMPWAQDFRMRVLAMNPRLGSADVEILAPLWAAFPDSWNLLARLGRVDNVVVEELGVAGYRYLNASFTLQPERMVKAYPELAAHLKNLGSLIKLSVVIENRHGRLLTLAFDSETLTGSLDGVVFDGRLLPVRDGRVIRPLYPTDLAEEGHYIARVDSRMDVFGVITHMRGIETDIRYKVFDTGAEVQTMMTEVPKIEVEGAAFGIVPTGIIDLFLPTNIDEIMREFMTVAVKGNGGRGIVTRSLFSQEAPGLLATFETGFTIEALNNFMLRFGMGIVSDRIIPDAEVSEELRQLIFETEKAFSSDLDAYERVAVL